MKTLTQKELADLQKIQSTLPARSLDTLRVFKYASVCWLILIGIGLYYIYNYRAPTVLQAMYFIGFSVLCNCVGYNLSLCLERKYLRMIHHLSGNLDSDTGQQTTAG